jgi:hypothetical protein
MPQAHVGVANAYQAAFLLAFDRHIGSFKCLSHKTVFSVERDEPGGVDPQGLLLWFIEPRFDTLIQSTG